MGYKYQLKSHYKSIERGITGGQPPGGYEKLEKGGLILGV